MAIIKCDLDELPPIPEPVGNGDTDTTVEAYVYTDKVSLGKTLLALSSV